MTNLEHNYDKIEENLSSQLALPSCIESLSRSAHQLQQLASQLDVSFLRPLLTYHVHSVSIIQSPDMEAKSKIGSKKTADYGRAGYNLDSDQLVDDDPYILNKLDCICKMLPFLKELSNHLEKCFATMDSTFRRLTYYFNKALAKKTSRLVEQEFNLTTETRIDPILAAMMDLLCSLASLDQMNESFPDLGSDLGLFQSYCKKVLQSRSRNIEDLKAVPSDQLEDLIEFIASIRLTVCGSNHSIMKQLFDHLRNLNLILGVHKTSSGFQLLGKVIERYIHFYCQYMIDPYETHASQDSLQDIFSQLLGFNLVPSLYSSNEGRRLFGIASIYILYSNIFPNIDATIGKSVVGIIQTFTSSHYVDLLGLNLTTDLIRFVIVHFQLNPINEKLVKQLEHLNTQSILDESENALHQKSEHLSVRAMSWLARFQHFVSTSGQETWFRKPENTTSQMINDSNVKSDPLRCLLDESLCLTTEINSLVADNIIARSRLEAPMSKTNLILLFKLIPMLKKIKELLDRHECLICENLIRLEETNRTLWRKQMDLLRKRYLSLKFSDQTLKTDAFIVLSDICLNIKILTNTSYGRIVFSLCLSILSVTMNKQDLIDLNQLVSDYGLILNYHHGLSLNTDCRFIFSILPTIGVYYNHKLEEDSSELMDIRYIHRALNDIPELFGPLPGLSSVDASNATEICKHEAFLSERRLSYLNQLGSELMEEFKVNVLDRLCQEFEIELRLQTHREIQLDCLNPFRRRIYNFKRIFSPFNRSLTFKIFHCQVSLEQCIEQHMNQVSYNLTALAPHDWPVYDEMSNLTRHRFNLQLSGNSQLPAQTLECGVDLLDIMRSFPVFLSTYNYDQMNQIFVERVPLSRPSSGSAHSMGSLANISISTANFSQPRTYLNIFKVEQVIFSIQTHGSGLLNSTINTIYQTMRRLVNLVSKQLQDEKLRSLLAKENLRLEQQVGSHSESCTIPMTIDQANKLARKLRPSQTNGNQSERVNLDNLRKSITQIGNSWGLLRVIKSGALDHAVRSAEFLPDCKSKSSNTSIFDISLEAMFTKEIFEFAAVNLEDHLANIRENLSSSDDFFHLIYDPFKEALDSLRKKSRQPDHNELDIEIPRSSERPDSKFEHLRLFYLLLPALTANFVDFLINCKDRVSSRAASGRSGALLTDDGFGLGLAFLISILDQESQFARLLWFEQALSTLEEDRHTIEQRIADPKVDESLKQTSSMTLHRLRRLRDEYACLQSCYRAGLLFFRRHARL